MSRFRSRRVAAVEQGRVEHERRLAGEERLRIARELHDALGHHISLIGVQATAALHGLRTLPATTAPEPAAALDAIKDTSGKALRELSSVLDILRHTDETRPPTGLDRLAVLVEDTRSAGFDVRLHVEPAPRRDYQVPGQPTHDQSRRPRPRTAHRAGLRGRAGRSRLAALKPT